MSAATTSTAAATHATARGRPRTSRRPAARPWPRPRPTPAQPDFGPNVKMFAPSHVPSEIQATVDAVEGQQVENHSGPSATRSCLSRGPMGRRPTAELPGGLLHVGCRSGLSPGDVMINGSVNTYNQCSDASSNRNCNALDNFWRSLSNLTINVTSQSGC